MGKHGAFWHASGAASIDKCATVSRANAGTSLFDCLISHLSSQIHEGLPAYNLTAFVVLSHLLVIEHDVRNDPTFQQAIILFCETSILGDYYSSLRMLGDVLTSALAIGRIDANWNATSEHRSVETDHPFRCVKANQSH